MVVKVILQTFQIKCFRNAELKYLAGQGNQEILCFACRLILKVGFFFCWLGFSPDGNGLTKNRCARL